MIKNKKIYGCSIAIFSLLYGSVHAINKTEEVVPPMQFVSQPALPLSVGPIAYGNYTIQNNISSGRNFVVKISTSPDVAGVATVSANTNTTNISNPCNYTSSTNTFYIPGGGATCNFQLVFTYVGNTIPTSPLTGTLAINYGNIADLTTSFSFIIPDNSQAVQPLKPAFAPFGGFLRDLHKSLVQASKASFHVYATTSTAGIYKTDSQTFKSGKKSIQDWDSINFDLPTNSTYQTDSFSDGTLVLTHEMGASCLSSGSQSWSAMKMSDVPTYGLKVLPETKNNKRLPISGIYLGPSNRGVWFCSSCSSNCSNIGLNNAVSSKFDLDNTGRLWSLTDQGVYFYDGNGWTDANVPLTDFFDIAIDPATNIVYITGTPEDPFTQGGVWGADADTLDWVDIGFPPVTFANSIDTSDPGDAEHNIYVGGYGGIVYISPADIINFTSHTLDDTRALITTIDSSGDVLLGTAGNGARYSDDEGANFITANNNLLGVTSSALLSRLNGKVLSAQQSGSTSQFDLGLDSWVDASLNTAANLTDLAEDSTGTVYASTDGDAIFSSTTGLTWSPLSSTGLPSNEIFSITVDGSDNLYAAPGGTGGAYVFTGANWSNADPSFDLIIYTLRFIPDFGLGDLLLAGTQNDGVYRYVSGAFHAFGTGFGGGQVYEIVASDDTVFAGTSDGLWVLDDNLEWSLTAFSGQEITAMAHDRINRVLYVSVEGTVYYANTRNDIGESISFFALDVNSEIPTSDVVSITTNFESGEVQLYTGTAGTSILKTPALVFD